MATFDAGGGAGVGLLSMMFKMKIKTLIPHFSLQLASYYFFFLLLPKDWVEACLNKARYNSAYLKHKVFGWKLGRHISRCLDL